MYSEKITINKSFQTSVNLDLDLGSELKVEEYIPTNDICDVIGKYFDTFLGKNNNRATTLVGPYGKGKSFLLLVLSYLVNKNPSSAPYSRLLSKISSIDKSLGEKIKTFRAKGKLLPIIINSNYNDLNQAFLLGLNDALTREKLANIVPDTTFNTCISLIEKWKSNPDFKQRALQKCLEHKSIGVSLEQIERGLSDYSYEYYSKFETLYSCLTGGAKFNPLVNDDVRIIYTEVNRKLFEFGYTGIFVIFDEFSKFLENDDANLGKDLKFIQDFAESATRSSQKEQINLCCVAHKSIGLYGKKKADNSTDFFKTVEGRFKEVKFNRSLEENYQIISASFSKNDMEKSVTDFLRNHASFYNRVSETFNLKRDEEKEALFNGCYPINPYTVLSLIQLSELVAQNERTLFTFISDTDENGFTAFINKNAGGLLNVDKLYDYFSPLLKKEENNSIREIWYRAESTLSKIVDNDERRITKALAIILMIGDFDKLSPSINTIADSLFMEKHVCESKIQALIENHFLRRNVINYFLAFATSNSREIDDRIITIRQTRLKSLELSTICNQVSEEKYLLPRRYNEQNKITRFFRECFLTEKQFYGLNSFELLENEAFCDGLVINVLMENSSEDEIKTVVDKINDPKVVVRVPSKSIDSILKDELYRYAALREILKEENGDSIVSKEIELLIEESHEDLISMIGDLFPESAHFFVAGQQAENKDVFKATLSNVMDRVFYKKTIFNNELVNKNSLSAQYQKIVNRVIDWVLDGRQGQPFSATSPEMSTVKAVLDKIDNQPDVRSIVDYIKGSIKECENGKVNICDIALKFTSSKEGYGIRRGVLPILFAVAISELSVKDNILLYFKDKEIDLDASNVVKAVYAEENYFFGFSKGSKAQSVYVERLIKLFNVPSSGNLRNDVKKVSEELRKFFVGLPAVIRACQPESNYMDIEPEILSYKNYFFTFNLNPFELVFSDAFKAFRTKNLGDIFTKVKNFKTGWNEMLAIYKEKVVHEIKATFRIESKSSIKMGATSTIKGIVGDKTPVMGDASKRIFNQLTGESSFDDKEAANNISLVTTGTFIEDWEGDLRNSVSEKLSAFLEELSNVKTVNFASTTLADMTQEATVETTPMGKLLENNLSGVFEEYGDSVTNEEKIAILSKMLKKLM